MFTYKQAKRILIFILLIIVISSCAHAGTHTKEYGFFSGIIHGIVFWFALISKLWTQKYALYAEFNTGFWYWAGYVIGLVFFNGGGGGVIRRRRR